MDYIVIGKVKPNISARDRGLALGRYLKRDPKKSKAVIKRELWDGDHPIYRMVFDVSAETRENVLELFEPWSDFCDFEILNVKPMRGIVEQHLASHKNDIKKEAVDMPIIATADSVEITEPEVIDVKLPSLPTKLMAVLTTNQYDDLWPEDNYSPSYKKVYDGFVKILGDEPKNGQLPSNAMSNITPPDQNSSKEYTDVYHHLVNELGYFQKAEEWFGHAGDVTVFVQEATTNNTEIISTLQNESALLAQIGLTTQFPLAILIKGILGVMAIGASGINPIAGGVLGFLATNATDFGGSGENANLNTTFGQASIDLTAVFNKMVSSIESWNAKLHGNWGKLSTFGRMASGEDKSNAIKWPIETSALRVSAQISFETYLWKLIFPQLSNLYRVSQEHKSQVGSVSGNPKFPKPPNHWNPAKFVFAYRTSKASTWDSGCPSKTYNGWDTITYAFGGVEQRSVAPLGTGRIFYNAFVPLPRDFMNHLFGSGTGTGSYDGTPSLGINPIEFFEIPINAPIAVSLPWAGINNLEFTGDDGGIYGGRINNG